jgi:hypothetical protein
MLRNSDRIDSICFASPKGAAEGAATIVDTSGCILVTKICQSIDGKHTSLLKQAFNVAAKGFISQALKMDTQATTRLIGIRGNAFKITIM